MAISYPFYIYEENAFYEKKDLKKCLFISYEFMKKWSERNFL